MRRHESMLPRGPSSPNLESREPPCKRQHGLLVPLQDDVDGGHAVARAANLNLKRKELPCGRAFMACRFSCRMALTSPQRPAGPTTSCRFRGM